MMYHYPFLRGLQGLRALVLLIALLPAWGRTASAQCAAVPPSSVDISSPAYLQVIVEDPFCCTDEWDIFCQAAYDALVGGGGGCTVVPPAGVDVSSPAYQQVIAEDPFCCFNEWDEFCQAAYDLLTGGGGGCTVVPPAGVDTSSPAYQQVIADDPSAATPSGTNSARPPMTTSPAVV